MPEAFAARTLRELTRVVFSHLVGMLVIIGLLTGGTYYACFRADPRYESSVTILVKQPKHVTTKIQEVSPDRSLQVFIKTQRELVLSDRVLSRTMALLGNAALCREWQQTHDALLEATPKQRDEARDRLNELLVRVDASADVIVSTRQRDLHKFRKKVDVETPGGEAVGMSEVFTITVQQKDGPGFNPGEQAQRVADLLAGCYIDRYWQVQAEGFRNTADLVQARLEDLKKDSLVPAQNAFDNFLTEKLGKAEPGATPTTQAVDVLNPADVVILEQLLKSGTEAGAQIVRRRFEEEKIRLGAEFASAESLQRQIVEQLDDDRLKKVLTAKHVDALEARALALLKPLPDKEKDSKRQDELKQIADELYAMTEEPRIIVPQQVLTNNDIINKMKRKLADLVIDRNRMRGQFAPTYRELVDLYVVIARAKIEIIEQLRAEKRALDVQMGTIQAQLADVAQQITRVTTKLDAIAKLLPEYDRLQSDLKTSRVNYATMETELLQAQADEQRARKDVTIQVIDRASTPDPDRPAIPKTPIYTGVALGVSFLLALAYAFLADHFNHTLRSIHEVERYLGTTVLGSVTKAGRRIVQ